MVRCVRALAAGILAVAAAVPISTALADAPDDGVLAELPFVSELPLFGEVPPSQIGVDLGPSQKRPLPLLLDTGSTSTSMTPEYANALNVTVRQHMMDRAYHRATLLNRDLQFWVEGGDAQGPGSVGLNIGLLGGDFLRDYALDIDYAARVVRVLDPQRHSVPTGGGWLALPMRLNDGRPEIEVELGGGTAWFVLDTGAGLDVEISSDMAGRLGLAAGAPALLPEQKALVGGHLVADLTVEVFAGERVTQLGGLDQALLGSGFLRRFRVQIDFPNRRVGLLPREASDWPAPVSIPAIDVREARPTPVPPTDPPLPADAELELELARALARRTPRHAVRPAEPAPQRVWLAVKQPSDGDALDLPIAWLEVEGWAGAGQRVEHDVCVVVDISGSTAYASGIDVDGDGKVGRRGREREAWRSFNPSYLSSDPGDTVLAAELVAIRRLLEVLDPTRTRVGLVSFSSTARTETPVGSHPEDLNSALEVLEGGFGSGSTNLAHALRIASDELLQSGAAEPRRRTILVISDGYPTAPKNPEEAAKAALEEAENAAATQITIDSFALGLDPPDGDDVYAAIADVTGGQLVRVEQPGEIVQVLPRINLAQVAGIRIENVTTGDAARALRVFADGSFDGFVPLQRGSNTIRVTARGDLGDTVSTERSIVYEPREPKDAAEAAKFEERKRTLLEALRTRRAETELALGAETGPDPSAESERELRVSTEEADNAD